MDAYPWYAGIGNCWGGGCISANKFLRRVRAVQSAPRGAGGVPSPSFELCTTGRRHHHSPTSLLELGHHSPKPG